MMGRKRTSRLDIRAELVSRFGGLNGGRDGGNPAVGHGLTLRETVLVRIVFLGAVTVLFGGIVEETTAAFKVFGVVLGAAGVDVAAKKGLGHGEFRDKGVGDGFAIRDSTA